MLPAREGVGDETSGMDSAMLSASDARWICCEETDRDSASEPKGRGGGAVHLKMLGGGGQKSYRMRLKGLP